MRRKRGIKRSSLHKSSLTGSVGKIARGWQPWFSQPLMSLRSLALAVFMVMTVIPYAFATLLWAVVRRPLRYRLTMGWPALIVRAAKLICGVRWEVMGLSQLPPGPVIFLVKHQSAWETLFLPAFMPRELCFVYKRELHWVPFFGWGLQRLDMISIDRRAHLNAFEQVVSKGTLCAAQGRSIVLFPEGTRVAPGQTVRFKTGGARLAVRCGLPVVPIAHNAGECWPRNAFFKRAGVITVSIGPVFSPEGLTADALNAQVEQWIADEMLRLPAAIKGSASV